MALACEKGNPDVVRALLEAGADARLEQRFRERWWCPAWLLKRLREPQQRAARIVLDRLAVGHQNAPE